MKFFKVIKLKYVAFILVLLFSLFLIHIVQAITAEPGTDGDPLVSQSYVDAKISTMTAKVNEFTLRMNDLNVKLNDLTAKNAELTKTVGDLTSKNTELTKTLSDLTAAKDDLSQQVKVLQALPSKFEVIQVKAGKQLIAGPSTEIIIRSGKATAIASSAGGVSDLISGADVKTGGTLTNNHLLLVPKDDGRGFKAVADVWVLIKGSYTIK